MSYGDLGNAVDGDQAAMTELLRRGISIPSPSGQERIFTEFIAEWVAKRGLGVDLWQASEDDIGQIAALPERFIPLEGRPTLVVRLPGEANRRSLIFNAHSDVVPAPQPEQWRHAPFSGAIEDGKVFGRGACDVKGSLISALWAMSTLAPRWKDRGDLLLELVPGEEDCVGLGTLTSVARGYKSDGAIVLEPTEGIPRCASRGGCRFEVTCHGKAVHGTVKWLGSDAIASLRKVLNALEHLETKWNDRAADPLFAAYPIMRPITVDTVAGGQWQGMTCDRASCAGYLELLPGDDPRDWAARLAVELASIGQVEVATLEHYHGHSTAATEAICETAKSVLASSGRECLWRGFNSGCEAGLRWRILKTPTLVWGPGSLEQAHAVDEFVELRAVRDAAVMMAEFADRWCAASKSC